MAARSDAPIGARRFRLAIEAPTLLPDGAGGARESFAVMGRCWASLRRLSGEERWRADRFEQAGRYEITLRWRAGIDAGMRFRLGARLFAILSVGDPSGARTQLVCLCEEITP
jgi:SPP1 family predicted phage head-tail adaptor